MAHLPQRERAALLQRFRRHLQDHRLPLTRPRDRIASIVFHTEGHLSAADIQRELADDDQQVGTATVYRTLELLVESGLVRGHDFGEGFKRYEAMTAQHGHEHLICVGCGTVVEFTNEHLERMLPVISDEHAFFHHRHHVEIYGLCRDCRRRDMNVG